MTERERLIDLIIASVDGCAEYWAGRIADYLLDNGVVLPPCRCKDCAYFDGLYEDSLAETAEVEFVCLNSELYEKVREDDYCPYGKRRADNGT